MTVYTPKQTEDKFSSPTETTDLSQSGNILLTPVDSYLTLEEPTLFYSKAKRISVVSNIADIEKNIPLNELFEMVTKEKSPHWVDVQGAEPEEIAQIGKMFNIHPLTVEDCTTSDTREKIEHIQNYFFVVMNELSYKENTNIVQNHNISIVVFQDLIVTFHHHPVYCVYDVVHKMETRQGGQVPSTEWILHALLDSIADAYETHINQLIVEGETLDELLLVVNCTQQGELLARINSASRRSSSLMQGLVNKEDVLKSLLNNKESFSPHAIVYLKNVFDQLLRMNQKLISASKLVAHLNSVYMSKVSVELSVASNETGHVTKLFAIVNVIFMPLNLIAGIFGMNVLIPGENNPNDDYPPDLHYYISILGIMGFISITMLFLFRRLHWLIDK